MYLFSSWAPQISHSCTKKEALVFLLNECRYLKPGKKLPRFFIQLKKIHLAKVQKTHTLLRLWTTACTAAPPKEEVKSSPCWSTMVTTDSKSSARRLVGPLLLPECSDIRYNVVDMVSLVRELRSSASKTRWTQSDTHLLCSRRSTSVHRVWNVQWQAVSKGGGKQST